MPACIEDVILPRVRDIGGFEILTGRGLDVRPHPHIGLSTVT